MGHSHDDSHGHDHSHDHGHDHHRPNTELDQATLAASDESDESVPDSELTPGGGVALIDTRDFLRPIRRDGRLILRPAAGNVLIPFELQQQRKFCADH